MKHQTLIKLGTRLFAVASLAIAAFLPARADYSSTILALNPLAYWDFDEAASSPPINQVANLGSLGAVANGVVMSNSVALAVSGKINTAAQFFNPGNTVGHCGTFIDVPYSPALNTPKFSVEFWANPTSFGGDATGFSPISNFNPNNFAGGRVGWLFYLNSSGRLEFRLGAASGSGYAAIIDPPGSANLVAGSWAHCAVTFDGTTVSEYINGALVKTGTASAGSWVPNTGCFLRMGGTPLNGDTAVLIANSPNGGINSAGGFITPLNNSLGTPAGNRGYDGKLDSVAIYSNVLSAGQILAHYNAGATPGTYDATILGDGPIAYWNLDEPAVTTPNPATFPIAANSSTLGTAADGTNMWGVLNGQAGPSGAGFGTHTKAITLDGVNGYVNVKDAAALHFNGNVTMTAWVNPVNRDYIRDIIARGIDDFGSETFLRISHGNGYGSGNYYECGSSDGAFGNYGYDSVLYPIPAGDWGKWVFLAATFDGSNWNLYRNGQLVGTLLAYNLPTTQYDFGSFNVTNNWTIGSRGLPTGNAGWFFGGSIAHAGIFNTALTPTQIANLYAAAQVPPITTTPMVNPVSVFKGVNITNSIFSDGTPPLSYAWTVNGVSVSSTSNSYVNVGIGVGTFTNTVVVTNPYGSATNSIVFTSVAAPPSIVSSPAGLTRYNGQPFSFSVTAGGSVPLTYRWYQGTTLVGTVGPGGASASYSGTCSGGTAGSYTVAVSNETLVSVTSAPVSLTVLATPTGYPGAVVADGPMAFWRLGEASGTVAHDYMNGHDGVYNSVALGQPGYSVIDPDTAAAFSSQNSYVGSIDGSAAATGINFTGHTNFTLEAWVNAQPGQNDEATIIAKGIGASGTTRSEQFSLDVVGGVYRFFTTGGNTLYAAQATEGPNGSWQHVVGVYDDKNTYGQTRSNLYIYVNGVLEGKAQVRAAGLNGTVSPVSIGSKRTGNNPIFDGVFQGTVDEVAVYPYALTASQINIHYSAAYGNSLAPFIAVQPVSVTNYVNLPVSLHVSAAGTQPLFYQWYKGIAPSQANPVGANSPTYTIPNVSAGDAGSYYCNISSTVNPPVNTAQATITVLNAPVSAPNIPGLLVHLPLNGSYNDVTGRGNNGSAVTKYSPNNLGNHPTAQFVTGPFGGHQGMMYETDTASGVGGYTNSCYVTLGARPDLLFSSNIDFTVSFWVQTPANYDGGDLPFFSDANGATFNTGFTFAPSYGYGVANASPTTPWPGGWAMSLDGAGYYGDIGSINDGNWHLLTHIVSRTKGLSTYLDGVAVNQNLQPGGSITQVGDINVTNVANIGQDPTGQYPEGGAGVSTPAGVGQGSISDLGVWGRALSPLEVASIYVAATATGVSYTGSYTPASIKINSVNVSGSSATLNWTATPFAGTSYSVLSSTTLSGGTTGWTPLATGITSPTYTDTSATGSAKFYRVTSP